jgi:hypothetical protein
VKESKSFGVQSNFVQRKFKDSMSIILILLLNHLYATDGCILRNFWSWYPVVMPRDSATSFIRTLITIGSIICNNIIRQKKMYCQGLDYLTAYYAVVYYNSQVKLIN